MANLVLALYAITTSLALIFLKLGTTAGGAPVAFINNKLTFNLGFYSVSAMILYGISFIVYTFLISRYDLGYIIPLATALVYIVIFVASFIIFKEVFTPLKIAGIAFILIGLVLLNLSK